MNMKTFQVKSNGNGTYSIYENGALSDTAKLKSIKQNFITNYENNKATYTLTNQEATIIVETDDGEGKRISGIPIS